MGVYGSNRVSKSSQIIGLMLRPFSRFRTHVNITVIFDPTGKHLKDIEFSGKNLTCPTWGGESLDILFVTSAKDPFIGIKEGDEGGNMFIYRIQEGPKGNTKFEFAG